MSATLPAWLHPLLDAEQMRATDAWAIAERGIPSLDLMERAGAGLARVVGDVVPEGPVMVVCGRGNNGGDGFVAARVLHLAGRPVRVLLAADRDAVEGDAKVNMDRLPVVVEPWDPVAVDDAVVLVDALLGTGFSGRVRGVVGEAVATLERASAPVIAADVPSGVDASTGELGGHAVRATATATFHGAKPGLWIAPGKERAGRVEVIPIGIPDGAPVQPSIGLIGDEVLRTVPRRDAASTKFSSGHVLVCGGSAGLTGAPVMASEGAMRAGAGYVTACVPGSLNVIFEVKLTEVMTRPLPDDDGALRATGADRVLEESERRGGALIVGPGLGQRDESATLARDVARRAHVPLVLDADGLNAHAGRLDDLAAREAPTVLTPHAGELGRLLGAEAREVSRRRLHHAREAARRAAAIVVLKGDDTLVAHPDGRVGVSRGDAPALATAGTGDVLSGVVAAMLAKGLEPFHAACAAVELHRRAGRLAGERAGSPDGVVATDVIAALAAVPRP